MGLETSAILGIASLAVSVGTTTASFVKAGRKSENNCIYQEAIIVLRRATHDRASCVALPSW